MYPPGPALGPLRSASLKDVPRIGLVATCGFYFSPAFQWERPYHAQHPADTLASYRTEWANVIKDPRYIVLVATNQYDPEEGTKSKATVPPEYATETPAAGEEVIVGMACWKLEENSKWVGQFQDDTGTFPEIPQNRNRDKNVEHVKQLEEKVGGVEEKHFQGLATMEMLVVHPAYWSLGHGTSLVNWGLQLAEADGVKQGVLAVGMGAELYPKLGYEQLHEVRFEGDEDSPQGLVVKAFIYTPGKTVGGKNEAEL